MTFNIGIYGRNNYLIIDFSSKSASRPLNNITCNIPGCMETFKNIQSYESHYNSLHRYACSVCHKKLPSPHLLDLHIEETHDSFFAVQINKRPMYKCFLEKCEQMSSDPKERRDHCIRDHKFPHDFRFDKINKNSSGNKNNTKMDVEETGSTSQSGHVFEVPKAFHFGHSSVKGFVKPKQKKKSIFESEILMKDLEESLPC